MQSRHIAKSVATLAVPLITLLATTLANAQDKGIPSRSASPPSSIKVGNRALQRTAFQVNTALVAAQCRTSRCSTTTPLFVRTAQCDGPIGKTCTLYLHVDSELNITNSAFGVFKFLVDGTPPIPGPTGTTGLVVWQGQNPSSGGVTETRSFSVVAYVTNTTTNQQHDIEIDIGCTDTVGDGCEGDAGVATLQAVVYTP
jgi:hypothetical protein